MLLSTAGRPDRKTAKTVIRTAVERGITLIDSADAYCLDDGERGHNERLIAEALAELNMRAGEDAPVVVATKGGNTRPGGRWVQDGRPDHLREACHASLRALKVERIALYHLHVPDRRVPFAESVGALARLREEGKIAAVGVSNVTLAQVREAETIVPLSSVQNAASVWDVGYRQSPIIRHCAARGIVFLAYSPLGGRDRAVELERGRELVALAQAIGVTPHELSLAWLMSAAPVVVPIPGARRVSRIDSHVRALTLRLAARDRRRVTRALRRLPGVEGMREKLVRRITAAIGLTSGR